MAIGGPESPQDMLRHDIGVPELDPTQQAMSAVEQASGQPTTSTPTSSVSRQRAPFSLTDAQYIPTTQELFPGNEVSMGRTTQVGKYGGAPIFQAGLANSMPVVAAIGGKLRSIANERERLKQQGEKLDLYGDFEKIDRPEYEPALNRWQVQKVDGIVRGAQEFYAGDNIKARAALADPMNPWGRRLRAETEAVNSVVRLGNDVFKEAASTVAGMDDGTVLFDQKEYDRANNILHAMEDPQADVRNISKDIKRWRATKDVAKYIKDQGIVDDILKQANIDITDPRYQRDPKTGRIYATQEQVKNFETVARSAAKGIQDRYKRQGIDLPMEDIMGYLPAPIQRDVKVVDTAWPPSASGGGSDSGFWSGPVTTANTITGDSFRTVQKDKGYERRISEVKTKAVGKIVQGRQEPFPVAQFKKGGDLVEMKWASIDQEPDGEFVLVGVDPTDTETQTNMVYLQNRIGDLNAIIRDGRNSDGGTDEQNKKRLEAIALATKERDELARQLQVTEKKLKKQVVPLKGNESVANGMMGGTLQQALAEFGQAPQQATPANGQNNSPLSVFPDAKQESDGAWYVIRNGKKKYLTQQ